MSDQKQQRLLGGRYRLHEVVGRGGMGTVWAGEDELLGRPVAVKEVLPPPNLSENDLEELRHRTLKEARAAARISSPAALTVHDVVEENGHPWIVMELLASRTLDDVLKERTLSPTEAATLGLTILSALRAAESAGVLHRDVKPANVMFRGTDDDVSRAVLTDFGIARFVGDPNVTMTGTLVGSPAYVAPERATGHPATSASDLWSLGVTLWTALEGRSPFEREGALPTLTAIVTEDLPAAQRTGPLAPVLEGLLRKEPGQRTAAAELHAQLQAVAGGGGRGSGSRTSGLAPVPPPETAMVPGRPRTLPPSRPVIAAAARVGNRPAGPVDDRPVRPVRPEPQPKRGRGLAGVLLALLVVGALAAALMVFFDPFGTDDPPLAGESGSAGEPVQGGAGATEPGTSPTTPAASPSTEPTSEPPTTEPAATEPATAEPAATEQTSAPAPPTSAPEPSSPAPPTSAPAPSSPAPPPPQQGVPDGFVLHQDPSGFAVAVPRGWTFDRPYSPAIRFNDPESSASVLIDQSNNPESDPVADWQAQEARVRGNYTDYQRVGEIEGITVRGWQGADWEFTYAAGGGRGHRLNRNLITTPGQQAYALLWTAPDAQWAQRRADFDVVFDSFQPKG